MVSAATAPTTMNSIPFTYPQSLSTYGRLRTPDPIAAAHNEKILPLRLPFSSLENVLLKNGFLKLPLGDMTNSAC